MLWYPCVIAGLSSCEKDLDPWNIVALEVESTPESNIPYDGSTFSIKVSSNTTWNVEVPDWITIDRYSGEGEGTFNATVTSNNNFNRRSGYIKIKAGGDEPKNNVAGHKTSTLLITQEGKQETIKINILDTKIERIQDGSYIITTNKEKYFYHKYKATIVYEVESKLSNEEIAEIAKDPYMSITLRQKWSFSVPGGTNTFYDYITIQNLTVTRGRHTVTGETEELKWGNHVESAKLNVYWTLPSEMKYTATELEFNVTDSRD